MLHAVDSDNNPKCKRGASLLFSLTLRVTMKCAIFDRVQYIVLLSRNILDAQAKKLRTTSSHFQKTVGFADLIDDDGGSVDLISKPPVTSD